MSREEKKLKGKWSVFSQTRAAVPGSLVRALISHWGSAQGFQWPGSDITCLPHSCHPLGNAGASLGLTSFQELGTLNPESLGYWASS